eukprot:Gb_15126 [translate_table: standard]
MGMAKAALMVMVITLFVQCNCADPYSAAPPPKKGAEPPLNAAPPPFRVAGLTRPAEKVQCYNPKSRCNGQFLQCPKECPERKPADPTSKGCFVDCTKCEATCKTRKPNCEGFGAICYDPRFVGGDGVMFYFHGKSNEDFSLVSDNNLQINAHFIGKRPEGRSRDYTWVQSLGIMFGTHTFTVGANKVARWDDSIDQFFFSFDNQPFTIPKGHLSVWNAPSADLTVERTAESNSISVQIPQMLELSIGVVPITQKDNLVHNYQIPSDDCFAHLEIQFKFFNLSPYVEGVLGQTYRPDFRNPVKVGVAMPIMGGEDRYKTSSLLQADCNACRFSPKSSLQLESLLVESTSIDCTSKLGNGNGIVCRR